MSAPIPPCSLMIKSAILLSKHNSAPEEIYSFRIGCSICNLSFRTLSTPTEETWPGVTELPDYKTSFPNWRENTLAQQVKGLNEQGMDLLQVTSYILYFIYLGK